MHPSAMTHMQQLIETYLRPDRHYDVLDFGSFVNEGQTQTMRPLLSAYDTTITGVDIQAGRNVDILMTKPYTIPVKTRSQDVVISGQVFEHIPLPFASILEIARVLRPGGHFLVVVPSRGHHHSTYDCWRFYPDSMRAFAAYAELELLSVQTDWPPRGPTGRRHRYSVIDDTRRYWGDTTAAFRKPRRRLPSVRRAANRAWTRSFANHVGDLSGVPRPKGTRLRGRRTTEVDEAP